MIVAQDQVLQTKYHVKKLQTVEEQMQNMPTI
jgi:hypothetical protein